MRYCDRGMKLNFCATPFLSKHTFHPPENQYIQQRRIIQAQNDNTMFVNKNLQGIYGGLS